MLNCRFYLKYLGFGLTGCNACYVSSLFRQVFSRSGSGFLAVNITEFEGPLRLIRDVVRGFSGLRIGESWRWRL